MDLQKSLVWFFNLPSVRYMQIFIVVMGDLLALSNLLPKHSMYISRPFLVWHHFDDDDPDTDSADKDDQDEEPEVAVGYYLTDDKDSCQSD